MGILYGYMLHLAGQERISGDYAPTQVLPLNSSNDLNLAATWSSLTTHISFYNYANGASWIGLPKFRLQSLGGLLLTSLILLESDIKPSWSRG